ncbi:substrate-binding periplasmic protein [Celeribacter halophilus]|uniref:substrate-binding periplasmic protein n=1 Tax=Celeribacter halophilus TaxID=576117 RepID=UPI003A8F83BC
MITDFKKSMKKFALGFAVASMLAMPAAAADPSEGWAGVQAEGKLRCGAAVFPPYVMRDPVTGEYSGFFSELCKQFGEEVLNVPVEFVDTTWDNIVAGLQSGKWDMSLALNRTPTRALAIAFSEPAVPYEITLVYNKSNPKIPEGASSLADFDIDGVTIAVVSGTAMDKSLTPLVENADIVRLPSSDEARLAVMSRRADVLADPSDSNALFVAANKDWAVDVAPVPAISKQGIGFGLNVNFPAKDIAALDIFIQEKIDTGAVDRLVEASVQEILAETE